MFASPINTKLPLDNSYNNFKDFISKYLVSFIDSIKVFLIFCLPFAISTNFYLISGWKDHQSQQIPLKPGEAKNKLKDFL